MDRQVINRNFQHKYVYCVNGGLYIQIWGQCEEEALCALLFKVCDGFRLCKGRDLL